MAIIISNPILEMIGKYSVPAKVATISDWPLYPWPLYPKSTKVRQVPGVNLSKGINGNVPFHIKNYGMPYKVSSMEPLIFPFLGVIAVPQGGHTP